MCFKFEYRCTGTSELRYRNLCEVLVARADPVVNCKGVGMKLIENAIGLEVNLIIRFKFEYQEIYEVLVLDPIQ